MRKKKVLTIKQRKRRRNFYRFLLLLLTLINFCVAAVILFAILPDNRPERAEKSEAVTKDIENGLQSQDNNQADIFFQEKIDSDDKLEVVNSKLSVVDNGDNSYFLCWGKTDGEEYAIQRLNADSKQWEDVRTYSQEDECIYNTGHLQPNENYQYKLISISKESTDTSNVLDEITIHTESNAIYATIWPMKDLNITTAPGSGEVNAIAKQAQGYCIVDMEKSGDIEYFLINTGTDTGFIDSRYCMINLPEYMGNLCSYNITNSYASIFKVHEFGVNKITGGTLPGYENVKLADGNYLVPLLYPVAQKLEIAAKQAISEGYKLKIYESYRPHMTTNYIYSNTNSQINNPVATNTYDGRTIEEYLGKNGVDIYNSKIKDREPKKFITIDPNSDEQQAWLVSYINELTAKNDIESVADVAKKWSTGDFYLVVTNLPEGGFVDESGFLHNADGSEVVEVTDEETVKIMADFSLKMIFKENYRDSQGNELNPNGYGVIYNDFISRNGYHMGSFLAASGSRHNKGTALDLTIEDIQTGEEMCMQTAMHDLSVYSVLSNNNEMAERLKNIMTGEAGFKGINSEWWHFQDDEINSELKDLPYMEKGISAKCLYTQDGKTFTERCEDGTFTS